MRFLGFGRRSHDYRYFKPPFSLELSLGHFNVNPRLTARGAN